MSMASIHFAVLGMVRLRPMTGYEIKQAYQKGPANFMPISFGQIYPVLARLEKEKMVRQDKTPGSRGSIRYSITSSGKEAMGNWLLSAGDATDYKELLLRLFFASSAELAGLRGHVESFRGQEQAELRHFDDTRKWLDGAQAGNPHLPVWKLIMEYGVMQNEFRIRWAEQALAFITRQNKRSK
jgi:DNA-binding PadR family transcriptional regulator